MRRIDSSTLTAPLTLASACSLCGATGVYLSTFMDWVRLGDEPTRFWTFFYLFTLCTSGTLFWTARRMSVIRQELAVDVRNVLDHLADGFVIIDKTNRILYANKAFSEITGICVRSASDLSFGSLPWTSRGDMTSWKLGQEQLLGFRHPESGQRFLAVTAGAIASQSALSDAKILTIRDATGAELYRAEMEGLLATVRHSSKEIGLRNETLKRLAEEDVLSGCHNRRALEEQAPKHWTHHVTDQASLACMMFDIDHFKSVNDRYGHGVGDEVIRYIGAYLRETFAGVGQVYRYGGEEFCVLLPRHDLNEARWIGERIRIGMGTIQVNAVDENTKDAVTITPTVSIGVSDCFRGAKSAGELIAQADKCLYIAKRRGRDQVVPFDDDVAAASIRTSDG